MATSQNHAVVFGASGINGWALVRTLLAGYPRSDTFRRVTAVLNRPLSPLDSQWPHDDRLQILTGFDLTVGQESLQESIKTKIDGAETISHVYYAAYRQSDNPQDECRINTEMIRGAVGAIESLSKALICVILITGTKAYGLQMLDKFPYRMQVPLSESLPRIPAEYAKDVFYYHEVDALKEMSRGKSWTWCEVRPDVIVGLAPIGNAHCMAQTMGIYLSLYAFVEGRGSEVPFPGTPETYLCLSSDSNQDIIARFSIFASLCPERSGGRAFNVADTVQPNAWSTRWPLLAKYFGLVGVGPRDGSLHPTEYVKTHREELEKMCQEHGLKTEVIGSSMNNPGARMNSLKYLPFDRTLDLTAARGLGFEEELSLKESWYSSFEKLKLAQIIPP